MENIPPCYVRIDKEGDWYYKGAPMIREEIILFFNKHITQGPDGRYLLSINDQKCYLEVEDTPFVVKRVSFCSEFKIILNDATQEELNLDTLWIGKDNVLYCTVKDNTFEARFNRPSYYELAKFVEYDKKREKFFLQYKGRKYYLVQRESII